MLVVCPACGVYHVADMDGAVCRLCAMRAAITRPSTVCPCPKCVRRSLKSPSPRGGEGEPTP